MRWTGRAAVAFALGVLVAFAVVLLAWASEDPSPREATSSARDARDAPTPSTTTSLPATTLPPTTVAPPPEEPAPEEPQAPAPVEPGMVDNAPAAPAPPSAPDPEPEAEVAPPSGCAGIGGGSMLDLHRQARCDNGAGDIGLDGGMNPNAQFAAERLMNSGACDNLFHSPELGSWYGGTRGENVACVFSSGGCVYDNGLVMNQWMQSADHRDNILNSNYHWLGVGTACDGTHTYYVVQFRG